MALDIYLRHPARQQPTRSAGAFDEDVHEALFAFKSITPEDFPLVSRLCDYYSNTTYTADELAPLIRELDILLRKPLASQIIRMLQAFRDICAEAKQQGYVVECAAD